MTTQYTRRSTVLTVNFHGTFYAVVDAWAAAAAAAAAA